MALGWRRLVSVTLLVVGLYGLRAVLRLNTEPSVPLGIWRLSSVPPVLSRGMVVLYPPPLASFPLHPWWVPFLKPIAGLPGDLVCVDRDGLWVRGEWYGVVYEEVGGVRIGHLEGCVTVREGEVFVASKRPRSHDSRYYGPVRVEALQALATPAWVGR